MPIRKTNGQICVSIVEVPQERRAWKSLSHNLDQGPAALELVKASPDCASASSHGRDPPASTMACSVAANAAVILTAEFRLLRMMSQTVRLGLRPRGWMAHQGPFQMETANYLIEVASPPCQNEASHILRSGNQHGSFGHFFGTNCLGKLYLPVPETTPPSLTSAPRTRTPRAPATPKAGPLWLRLLRGRRQGRRRKHIFDRALLPAELDRGRAQCFTHRGAAMRITAGDFILEVEDMGQVNYPKQRFCQGHTCGSLLPRIPYNPGPVEEQEAEQASQPQPPSADRPPSRLAGLDTELWLEDPPEEVAKDRKLQQSLARLHVNMGHAPRAELVQILAASGNLSREVLSGLDCLRCGSCIRTLQPRQQLLCGHFTPDHGAGLVQGQSPLNQHGTFVGQDSRWGVFPNVLELSDQLSVFVSSCLIREL